MTKQTLAFYGIKDRNSADYPIFVHDHNLCIMQDGHIVQYLQLERYTHRKYDNRLDLFIEELIDDGIVALDGDFDLICVNDYSGNAFISKNGRLHFEANSQDKLLPESIPARAYLSDKDGWGGRNLPAWCLSHELAHIFSTVPFYGNFRENSLLISFDGASSLGNYSAFLFRDGKITFLENNWTDLGFASKFFNDNKLVFKILGSAPMGHCSVPGKLMGFASWGEYCPEIEDWLRTNKFFNGCSRFHGREILASIQNRFGDVVTKFDTRNAFLKNCAATLQSIFQNAVLQKLESLQKKIHADYLYYGGGCALNIVTNTRIVTSGLFQDVFIAPCCNDSGLSVGAAAYLEMQKGNDIHIHSPYLSNVGLEGEDYKVSFAEIQKTAELLMNQKIIGVCNGNGEIGPRALGNRSLIALADSRELSRRLSEDIKKREWYRPIAPIMLFGNAKKVSEQQISHLARFMLMDFTVKKNYREALQGVVHVNNTARIQTLSCEDENPFMFQLLSYLYAKYGVHALINTSFNGLGEPIVQTEAQAFESAKKMGLDGLVINGKLSLVEEMK